MSHPVIVSESDSIRIGERIGQMLDEEFRSGKAAGENRKASMLSGTLLALVSLIEASGPFRPQSLAAVERAAKACLVELVSMSDAADRRRN